MMRRPVRESDVLLGRTFCTARLMRLVADLVYLSAIFALVGRRNSRQTQSAIRTRVESSFAMPGKLQVCTSLHLSIMLWNMNAEIQFSTPSVNPHVSI